MGAVQTSVMTSTSGITSGGQAGTENVAGA